jgi:hypothetical protein
MNSDRSPCKFILKTLLGIAGLLAGICFSQDKLKAQDLSSLAPAEQFVLQEIQKGKKANLADFSEKPEDRVLRHEFVEKLLAGGYNSGSQIWAIRVENAVLNDRLYAVNETIPFAVWLTFCQFKSGVNFSDAKLANSLSFENSSFGSPSASSQNLGSHPPETDAEFAGMEVNGTVTLSKTTFYVPVDFTFTQVARTFLFDDVELRSDGIADFTGLTTHGPAFFRHDKISGPVYFTEASLFELFLEDITFTKSFPNDPDLTLDLTQVTRALSMTNIAFRWLQARYVETTGPATFDKVSVSKKLSLAHSRFQTLTVKDLDLWKQESNLDIDFEGLSFEGVDIPKAKVDDYASRMLDLINSPRYTYYSPQPYLVLEKFLRSHGNLEKADEVYIDMRRRERRELAYWKWPGDLLLDGLLGYGKKAWRAAVFFIGFAVIGAFVFQKRCMQLQDPKFEKSLYSPFLYSLDTLAPVIDLGQAKVWEPGFDHPRVRTYAQIQRIAGWILVPLILGAITGIIK